MPSGRDGSRLHASICSPVSHALYGFLINRMNGMLRSLTHAGHQPDQSVVAALPAGAAQQTGLDDTLVG